MKISIDCTINPQYGTLVSREVREKAFSACSMAFELLGEAARFIEVIKVSFDENVNMFFARVTVILVEPGGLGGVKMEAHLYGGTNLQSSEPREIAERIVDAVKEEIKRRVENRQAAINQLNQACPR